LELQAQSNVSYVVLNQGDTLYGKVSTDISGHIKLKEQDILRDFMSDHEEMAARIKSMGWNEKNLLRVVNEYNDWHTSHYAE